MLEHLGSSFLGPSFLELREAIGDAREEVFTGLGPAVAAAHVWFACSRQPGGQGVDEGVVVLSRAVIFPLFLLHLRGLQCLRRRRGRRSPRDERGKEKTTPAPLASSPDVKASSPDVKAPGGALDLNFPSTPRSILQIVHKLTSVQSGPITVKEKTFPRTPDDY